MTPTTGFLGTADILRPIFAVRRKHLVPDDDRESLLGRSTIGDIWFTPARLVLTSDWEVRDARPGDTLLEWATLTATCELGGTAVSTMEQLQTHPLPGSVTGR